MNERKLEIQVFRVELDEKTTLSQIKKNRINQKIKSIILSRSSNPNVEIKCKLAEGDEFVLIPGRVVNLKEPTKGVILAWEAYPHEWAELEISEDEHLVAFTPQAAASVASNIATKKFTKIIPYITPVATGGNPPYQQKILESNPNRIKAIVESFCWDRVFIGNEETTGDAVAYSILTGENEQIMPFCKKEFQSSDALFVHCDEGDASIMMAGGVSSYTGFLKVTEYIK